MIRATIIEPERVVLDEAADPKPGPGEVAIAVEYCGICGSDVHVFHDRHPFVSLPVVPGHEFSGQVAVLGSGVSGIDIGARVTVEPQVVCGRCPQCREGRYNICEELKVIGCQTDGAMAEYVVAPADRVIPLPSEVDFKLGATVEPMAVGVHAMRMGGAIGGKNLLIIGAGTIGLCVLMAARASEECQVTVSDPISSRLDLARKLGAQYVTQPDEVDIIAWSREVTNGHGFDLVIDCVGSESALETAVRSVGKGGRVVMVGVYAEPAYVPVGLVQDRELSLTGSLMYVRQDFEKAMELIAGGIAPIGDLITHEFPLSEIYEAFRIASDPSQDKIKVMLNVKSG